MLAGGPAHERSRKQRDRFSSPEIRKEDSDQDEATGAPCDHHAIVLARLLLIALAEFSKERGVDRGGLNSEFAAQKGEGFDVAFAEVSRSRLQAVQYQAREIQTAAGQEDQAAEPERYKATREIGHSAVLYVQPI